MEKIKNWFLILFIGIFLLSLLVVTTKADLINNSIKNQTNNQIPKVVGEAGQNVIWKINQTGNEQYLNVDIQDVNETSSKVCITNQNKTLYSSLLLASAKDITNVPVKNLNKSDDKSIFDKTSLDLSKDEDCFFIYYPKLIPGLQFKIGWQSIDISTEASNIATAYGNNENICQTPDGILHSAWEGDASDLWYGNSTDNGATWSAKELSAGTYERIGIVCEQNGNIDVYYGSSGDLGMTTSTDGGETFTGTHTIWDNIVGGSDDEVHSCQPDSLGNLHCCVVDIASDLWYTNNTSDQTKISSTDSEHCDVELNSTNDIFIVVSEDATNTLAIMQSADGWTTRTTIHTFSGISANNNPESGLSLAINNLNEFWIAIVDSVHDLYVFNTSQANILGNWSGGIVDAGVSYNPDIAVTNNSQGIFVLYQSTSQGGTLGGEIIYSNRTNNANWSIRQNLQGGGGLDAVGWASISQSRFADSNQITNYLYYVFYNNVGTKIVFDYINLTTILPSTITVCVPVLTGTNVLINCSENCYFPNNYVIAGNLTLNGNGYAILNSTLNFNTSGQRLIANPSCSFRRNGNFQIIW